MHDDLLRTKKEGPNDETLRSTEKRKKMLVGYCVLDSSALLFEHNRVTLLTCRC
jgi:hypothetical protein